MSAGGGIAAGSTWATIPAGLRPSATILGVTDAGGAYRYQITTGGLVSGVSGGATAFAFQLDDLTYSMS
jgi:hypothetical protein